MLLCAGRGVRFRPVTERIPKPLFPFLNVPLVELHLRRLEEAGIAEVGINLHHLGGQIERHLRDRAADLTKPRFFYEARILGTAGALANAASWLSGEDFLVVNADTAIEPDFPALLARHRETGRAATLLLVENRDPDRCTPLQTEGDRVTAFGRKCERPLLYTGVCVLAPRVLSCIGAGERSLVADLWQPLLDERKEEIGWRLHEGPFSDLGRPSDFLRATLEAVNRGGPFPEGGGVFDPGSRVLSFDPPRDFEADSIVLGRARIGKAARISESAVWEGAEIGAGARITRCLVAGGRIPPAARHEDVLLWKGTDGTAIAYPL